VEILLAVATILGGVTALWFIAEKLASLRKPKVRGAPASTSIPERRHEIPSAAIPPKPVHNPNPFFLRVPFSSLDGVLAEAKRRDVPVFAVIYDPDHPTQSKLYYSLGYFMEYHTTKRLVDDHFVVALLPVSNPEARQLVPENDPLENCLWVVLSPDGGLIRREGVYANPDEGLKRVREVVGRLDGSSTSHAKRLA
jgi:hypothetical protein